MGYLVVSGSERKEFDSIEEAAKHGSYNRVIYEQDAFGNLTPIRQEDISKIMRKETKSIEEPTVPSDMGESKETKQPPLEQPIQQEHNKPVDVAKVMLKEPNKKEGESTMYKIMKYVLLIGMAAILLFFVFIILRPLMLDFYTAFMEF